MATELVPLDIEEHAPKFDEKCRICKHPQRVYLEKLYVQRKPMVVLINIFGFQEEYFHLHARAAKIYSLRANNTKAIVNMVLEQGHDALKQGKMEITMKDLQWAVGHRDKILGRTNEKVEVEARVLHLHTSVPGVGGIDNEDVKQIREAKQMEELPAAPGNLIFEIKAEEVENNE